MLAWIADGLTLLSAIFFFVSGSVGKKYEHEKYKFGCKSVDNPTFENELCRKPSPIFLAPSTASVENFCFIEKCNTFTLQNTYCGVHSIPNAFNGSRSPHMLPRTNISNISVST